MQSVWLVAQLDADPDGQGAGVAWVGGGERGGCVVGERTGPEGFQVAADPDLDPVWDCEADDLALVLADLQLGVVGAGDDHEFASGASDSCTPRLPGQTKGDKMAKLTVFKGQTTVIVQMSNDGDLLRLMEDARDRIEAGEGFWVASAGDRSTGAQTLWVPPRSMVQFGFDSTVPPRVE